MIRYSNNVSSLKSEKVWKLSFLVISHVIFRYEICFPSLW
jgi:hypothetical protein